MAFTSCVHIKMRYGQRRLVASHSLRLPAVASHHPTCISRFNKFKSYHPKPLDALGLNLGAKILMFPSR
ncbi:MAG: hypothetical protein QW577_00150 [Candidatus Bathyarchaeia archaeon]